jgi:hypothetical protein
MQQPLISKWAITPLRLDPDAFKVGTIILSWGLIYDNS